MYLKPPRLGLSCPTEETDPFEQSGLSASIRLLERELGASLLVEARRALSATDAAKDAVAAVQGLHRGRLAIGSLQCLHVVHLPAVLAAFLAAHPGLEIRLRQGGSGECAPEHPFAARTGVKLAELAEERFVDFHPDWGTRDLVDSVLADAGVERRVSLEVTDVHSLLDLVTFGLGVALVPQSFAVKTDRVRFIGLAGSVPPWETVTVTADPTGAAAAALLKEVHEAKSGRRPAALIG